MVLTPRWMRICFPDDLTSPAQREFHFCMLGSCHPLKETARCIAVIANLGHTANLTGEFCNKLNARPHFEPPRQTEGDAREGLRHGDGLTAPKVILMCSQD